MSRLRLARSVPQAAILCGALSAALVSPLPASAAWLPNGTPVGRVGSDTSFPRIRCRWPLTRPEAHSS